MKLVFLVILTLWMLIAPETLVHFAAGLESCTQF
jgi:hypothetical protein